MSENHNLYHLFEQHFLAAGEAPALSPPDGAPGLSYNALAEGAGRYANAVAALSRRKLGPGAVPAKREVDELMKRLAENDQR